MRKQRKSSDGRLGAFIIYFLRYVKLDNAYRKHPTFQRFAKYGVLTTLTFWIVKSPLILLFDWFLQDIDLLFFILPGYLIIPGYLLSAFVAGVIVTLLGFVYSEWSIWKK